MKKNIIIFIIISVIVLTSFFLNYLNNKIMPRVMAYAKINTEKIGTIIINDAISKKVLENLNTNELFIITRNSNDDIVSIDFNTVVVNKILTTATHQIELSLTFLEKDKIDAIDLPNNIMIEKSANGIYFLIPAGVAFKTAFLSNLGPKIPVKLEYTGSVTSNISTNITNYGINNALMEVYLDISITLKVIIPFISEDVVIETKIPLIIKMINGKIPEYYLNGYLNSPTM
jgi:sporulation protein YunB